MHTNRSHRRQLKTALVALVFFLITATVSSCYTMKIDPSPTGVDILMRGPDSREYTIVGSFDEEVRVGFSLGGLIALEEVDVDGIANAAIDRFDGDAVINVMAETKYGGLDILNGLGVGLAGGSLGLLLGDGDAILISSGASLAQLIFSTRTARITGDVIRYLD